VFTLTPKQAYGLFTLSVIIIAVSTPICVILAFPSDKIFSSLALFVFVGALSTCSPVAMIAVLFAFSLPPVYYSVFNWISLRSCLDVAPFPTRILTHVKQLT
jgi:hypothetical protein